jgi:hypothetical protein
MSFEFIKKQLEEKEISFDKSNLTHILLLQALKKEPYFTF